MFENLLAEMTRKRVTKKEMASILKMSEWTFLRKLNGESQFTLNDMLATKEFFNNEHTIEYLFFEGYKTAEAKAN